MIHRGKFINMVGPSPQHYTVGRESFYDTEPYQKKYFLWLPKRINGKIKWLCDVWKQRNIKIIPTEHHFDVQITESWVTEEEMFLDKI